MLKDLPSSSPQLRLSTKSSQSRGTIAGAKLISVYIFTTSMFLYDFCKSIRDYPVNTVSPFKYRINRPIKPKTAQYPADSVVMSDFILLFPNAHHV